MGSAFNRIEEQRRSIRQFRDSIGAHPFLCISFGLYWMQTILLFQSPYLFLEPSPLAAVVPFPKGTALLIASVVTYLAWSLNFRRVNRFSEARWFPFALGAVLVAGALLYGLYPALVDRHRDLAIVAYLAGSVLIGCGTANICLETGRMFGYLGPLRVLFHGSAALLTGIGLTALVSGLLQFIFFPNAMLLGASGIVFMLIMLSSLAGMRNGQIPLTLVLVALLYLGQEVYSILFVRDSVANFMHIVGGTCGTAFGFAAADKRKF